MTNHLFGTSPEFIKQNPHAHQDVRTTDLFKLALSMADQGLYAIDMIFNENHRVCFVLKTKEMEPCIIETAIMNPDGMPFKSSSDNALQILLGPEKTMPLAIEAGSKAVTYNAKTGFSGSEYTNRAELLKAHRSQQFPQKIEKRRFFLNCLIDFLDTTRILRKNLIHRLI